MLLKMQNKTFKKLLSRGILYNSKTLCSCLYIQDPVLTAPLSTISYSHKNNMAHRSTNSMCGFHTFPRLSLPSRLRSPSPSEDNIANVRHLIGKLNPKERKEILLDLQYQESEEAKQKAEEKLASYRWRSRFGRPSSLPHPTAVDPTGTYCELPDEWLQKMIDEKKPVPPTRPELRQIALFNALPFIGFGFLDNVIMIVAGDYIDTSLGIYFGISTMAAAALGNTISDLAGIGSAWYVEMVASKLGVQHPAISQEQLDMPSSRWSANIGRSVGVVLGCILGMLPLLFLPDHSRDKDGKNETTKEK